MKNLSISILTILFPTMLICQDVKINQPISDGTRSSGYIMDEQFNGMAPHEQKAYLRLLDSAGMKIDEICWLEEDLLNDMRNQNLNCRITGFSMYTDSDEVRKVSRIAGVGGTLPYPQCIMFTIKESPKRTWILFQFYH